MRQDRTAICAILSEMLDNPDEHGIYPTSTAFTRLESYIEGQRMEVLGWALGDCCVKLDKGGDPRLLEVPDQIARMRRDLNALDENLDESALKEAALPRCLGGASE